MSGDRDLFELTPYGLKVCWDIYQKEFAHDVRKLQKEIKKEFKLNELTKPPSKDSIERFFQLQSWKKGVARKTCQLIWQTLCIHDPEAPDWDEIFQPVMKQRAFKSPNIIDFDKYIDLKLKDFVGREHVFEAFDTFKDSKNSGYFILIANPGEGKSAIAAHYVCHHPCFFYFNRRIKNLVTPEQFLQHLCHQLIDAGGLKVGEWPANATRTCFFLADLLERYVKKHGEVVIVVDALDEAEHDSSSTILHLPGEELPKGVYFFLTTRRDEKILGRLPRDVRRTRYDLANYQSQCESDVRQYLKVFLYDSAKGVARRKKLAAQSQSKSLAESKKILIRNSDRNFMYLTLVLPQIMAGRYQNLKIDQLPQGLSEYYKEHLEHMIKIMQRNNIAMDTLKIVYHISQAKSALSLQAIADFAQKDIYYVDFIVRNWMQFFDPEEMEEREHYTFYHESYQDYLRRPDTRRLAGNISTKQIVREKIDHLVGDVDL